MLRLLVTFIKATILHDDIRNSRNLLSIWRKPWKKNLVTFLTINNQISTLQINSLKISTLPASSDRNFTSMATPLVQRPSTVSSKRPENLANKLSLDGWGLSKQTVRQMNFSRKWHQAAIRFDPSDKSAPFSPAVCLQIYYPGIIEDKFLPMLFLT